ncbi:MAG: DUF86 domain-containing protein [Oscillospiraceae bacterium]|nr:DUF86 domain-containing protein [Oscillospiraceae bacterium]
MDSKDVAVLKKMLQHTRAILDYCKDCKSLSDFERNTMRVEATVFNLMQLGELAKQSLSDETKAQITTIPWQQIYGLRNRIVHGYAGVNMKIVWDTVSYDIPELHNELKSILYQE